jgi:hypothetical protein
LSGFDSGETVQIKVADGAGNMTSAYKTVTKGSDSTCTVTSKGGLIAWITERIGRTTGASGTGTAGASAGAGSAGRDTRTTATSYTPSTTQNASLTTSAVSNTPRTSERTAARNSGYARVNTAVTSPAAAAPAPLAENVETRMTESPAPEERAEAEATPERASGQAVSLADSENAASDMEPEYVPLAIGVAGNAPAAAESGAVDDAGRGFPVDLIVIAGVALVLGGALLYHFLRKKRKGAV